MSSPILTRRTAIASMTMAFAVPLLTSSNALSSPRGIEAELEEIEARSGGRLGVAVLESATGQIMGNRIDERFAMCSTMKALAVAHVLARVDLGKERLDRRIAFTERDLVTPYRATQPHVGPEGMSIEALCEAAITVSDSTAANLLLTSFGGPIALTAYLRSLGDHVTRSDLFELALNVVNICRATSTFSPAVCDGKLQLLSASYC